MKIHKNNSALIRAHLLVTSALAGVSMLPHAALAQVIPPTIMFSTGTQANGNPLRPGDPVVGGVDVRGGVTQIRTANGDIISMVGDSRFSVTGDGLSLERGRFTIIAGRSGLASVRVNGTTIFGVSGINAGASFSIDPAGILSGRSLSGRTSITSGGVTRTFASGAAWRNVNGRLTNRVAAVNAQPVSAPAAVIVRGVDIGQNPRLTNIATGSSLALFQQALGAANAQGGFNFPNASPALINANLASLLSGVPLGQFNRDVAQTVLAAYIASLSNGGEPVTSGLSQAQLQTYLTYLRTVGLSDNLSAASRAQLVNYFAFIDRGGVFGQPLIAVSPPPPPPVVSPPPPPVVSPPPPPVVSPPPPPVVSPPPPPVVSPPPPPVVSPPPPPVVSPPPPPVVSPPPPPVVSPPPPPVVSPPPPPVVSPPPPPVVSPPPPPVVSPPPPPVVSPPPPPVVSPPPPPVVSPPPPPVVSPPPLPPVINRQAPSGSGLTLRTQVYPLVGASDNGNWTIVSSPGGALESFALRTFPAETRGTNTNFESGGLDGVLGWTRLAGGQFQPTMLTSSVRTGSPIIWGRPDFARPTSGVGTYALMGQTSIVSMTGTEASGTLNSGTIVVNFGTSLYGIELGTSFNGVNYTLSTQGGIAAPSVLNIFRDSLQGNGDVVGGNCTPCLSSFGFFGFLAGEGSSHLGLSYFFAVGPRGTSPETLTGVAAFKRAAALTPVPPTGVSPPPPPPVVSPPPPPVVSPPPPPVVSPPPPPPPRITAANLTRRSFVGGLAVMQGNDSNIGAGQLQTAGLDSAGAARNFGDNPNDIFNGDARDVQSSTIAGGEWRIGRLTNGTYNSGSFIQNFTANEAMFYGLAASQPSFIPNSGTATFGLLAFTSPAYSNGSVVTEANLYGGIALRFGSTPLFGIEGALTLKENGVARRYDFTSTGGLANPSTSVSNRNGVIALDANATVVSTDPRCSAGQCRFTTGLALGGTNANLLVGVYGLFTTSGSRFLAGAAVYQDGSPVTTAPPPVVSPPPPPPPPTGTGAPTGSGLFSYSQGGGVGLGLSFPPGFQRDIVSPISGQLQSIGTNAIGTATNQESGGLAGVLGWTRWTGGTPTGRLPGGFAPAGSTSIIWGVGATAIPTTGSASYDLVGQTAAGSDDGSIAAGTLRSGAMRVNFSDLKVGVELVVGVAGIDYSLASIGGVAAPSFTLGANGTFGRAGSSSALMTISGNGCTSASCEASINGFLAGPGASHAGVSYSFNTTPTPASSPVRVGPSISGVAAFARRP